LKTGQARVRAAFSDREGYFYVIHPNEPKVVMYNWVEKRKVAEFDPSTFPCIKRDPNRYIPPGRWIPFNEGKHILLGYCDAIYLLDGTTFEVVATLVDGVRHSYGGLDITPAQDKIAIAVFDLESHTGEVWIFEVPHWQQPRRLPVRAGIRIAFSPDGTVLAAGFYTSVDEEDPSQFSEAGVSLYEVDTGRFVRRVMTFRSLYKSANVFEYIIDPQILFTRDGRYLLTTDFRKKTNADGIAVWDVERGELARTLRDKLPIGPVLSLSPDGRWVAADVRPLRYKRKGFRIRNYKIWDFETGRVLYESPKYWRVFSKDGWLRAHYGTKVEFSKDGKYLLEVRPEMTDQITVYEISVE
jgi:WD40 repeat protein